MVTGISFASAFCRRIWIRLRRCRREIPPVTLLLDLFRGNVEGACDEFAAKKYSAFEGSARDQIGDSGGRHNQQISAGAHVDSVVWKPHHARRRGTDHVEDGREPGGLEMARQ